MATILNARNLMLGNSPTRSADIFKSVSLSADKLAFLYNGTGALNPTTQVITITAVKAKTSAPIVWTTVPAVNLNTTASDTPTVGTVIPSGTSVASGTVVYLRSADFGSNVAVQVVATITDGDVVTSNLVISKQQMGVDGTPGTEGTKSITITAFAWSNSGTPAYSGALTYTWATGAVSLYPTGWTATAGAAPATGYVLYQINLIIVATLSATATTTNWTAATSSSIGYRQDGSIGVTGDSYRTAYLVTTSSTAPAATLVSGTGNVVPTSTDGTWSFTATSSLTAGQYMYQVDGIYNIATNKITWNLPYLSNLKVGSLSALAVDTGNLTISTTGSIKNVGGGYNAAGFFLGYDTSGTAGYKFSVGGSSGLTYDGTTVTIGAVTVDSAGNIQGIGTGTGTMVQNSKISVNSATGTLVNTGDTTTIISNNKISVDSAGTLQGIGTGTGIVVDNSKVIVGARNLLIGASTGTNWTYTTYSGTEFGITAAATGETAYIYSDYITLPASTQITLSFESKQVGSVSSVDLSILPVTYSTEGLLTASYTLSTSYVKNVFTFTTPATWVSPVRLRIDHNGGSGTSSTVYARNIKLEYGNKATDWTPPVEDISANISARLSKTAADTLVGPINLAAANTITVGTPALDGVTGHNGFYIGSTGLVATKNGAATVSITNAGDATFAGTLAANTVTTTSIATGAVTAASISAGAVTADKLTVGNLSAISANLGTITAGSISGTSLSVGSTPAIITGSGTTSMTGSGALINTNGSFAIGNSTSNISASNTGAITINGNLIATGNINGNGVTSAYVASVATGVTSVSVAIVVPTSASAIVVNVYAGAPYITSTYDSGSKSSVYSLNNVVGTLTVNGTAVTSQENHIIWSTGTPTVGSYNVSVSRTVGAGPMFLSVLVIKR